MIPLSSSWKVEAATRAPIGRELHRPDTRVVRREGWHQIVTPSAPRGSLNEVTISVLSETDVERAIDDAIAVYRAAGQPTKWCVGPWTRPVDMGERLARRGFEASSVRGMGCATDAAIACPPDVSRFAVDDATFEDYLATTIAEWSMGDDQIEAERAAHRAAMAATPRTAWFFGARWEGAVVGTAGLLDRDGYGYLIGGVVAPRARGRGVYRALVAARLEWLRARGLRYAVTQAREATSAPMLEHLGFETLFRSTCWRLDVYPFPDKS